jgi:5-methylcytosine-specific restriction endonuclease McrA
MMIDSTRRRKILRDKRIKNSLNLEIFNPFEVFNRDKWKCQCCSKKLKQDDRGKMIDKAPELDHIIPLSKGGEHNRRNTQLLCRKCNGAKSNNGYEGEQMLLVG